MSKFSKMLGVAAAAFAALCATGPASEAAGNYYGRSAGAESRPLLPHEVHGVTIYRPRFRNGGIRTERGVTIYGGGGVYLSQMRAPEHTGPLNVVSVFGGASGPGQSVDAACVNGGGNSMPAARLHASDQLSHDVHGELFRCEDGFTLRAVAGSTHGRRHGAGIACRSGTSLWRTASGALSCAPKSPLVCSPLAHACGEASLRHANGIGAIEIEARRYAGHPAVTVTRGMTLTGGVGYAPY